MNSELMLEQLVVGTAITEFIIFLSYIIICAALFKSRFSQPVIALAVSAAAILIAGVNIAVMLSGSDNLTLMLTMFPLTAYLPFSVLLYFLSDSGIFETAAVCSVGTLDVLILKSLQKILTIPVIMNAGISAFVKPVIINAAVVFAAAGLLFAAFRFMGGVFRTCVIENRQNRLLLAVPTVTIFLMMSYYLNSTTNTVTLIFTALIALSIFFIIIKLLNSAAELIGAKRSEREMSE
ncbi:MAG: hypothetical protein K2K41_06605, partial [Ruminiclostridium sp.]|nr:hypothetical protein [Ruminiclostridium sp.]